MLSRQRGKDAMSLPRRLTAVGLGLLAFFLLALPGAGEAASVTNGGSDLRDGWYGNQPALAPQVVGGSTFGKLWDRRVTGQVYAQPLLSDGHVVVATEENEVSSLDAETGVPAWTTTLVGSPWHAADVGCHDLWPDIGVTGTPVIDPATQTIYLAHKGYAPGSTTVAKWWLDALDATTGAERAGFPVEISGTADNVAGMTFNARNEMQRPGLLLLDGVVYVAFGSHCDVQPWQGWVFGVSTAGTIKARWVGVKAGSGAGIWQAGSGLMSDGPGRLFIATGNGGSPVPPRAGNTPGGALGESVVRLDVQPDGTLQAKDFFAPYDAANLDDWDADFASGGVTALRDDVFGTAAFPHLAVAVGKSGYIYLLNRDDLGGMATGSLSSDRVVQRIGPNGGVWSRPAVWPGDGGWVYVPTASGGDTAWGTSGYLDAYQNARTSSGAPTLSRAGRTTDAFGFGSSAPVVTSDGTTSGSALVWTVWMPAGDGKNAQLRAYDAVPQGGVPHLRASWPVGTASKFNPPGVGNGRIYVGTRDGHLLAFGAPVAAKLTGGSTTFPTTTVGSSAQRTATLTATGHLTVTGVAAAPAAFSATTSGLVLPRTLEAGQTLSVPLTFTPGDPGPIGGTLSVTTDAGDFTFSLTGTGQAAAAKLGCAPPLVSFGGVVVGQSRSDAIALCNQGGQPLTITSVELPGTPFSAPDAPAAGQTIAPGATVSVPVSFVPSAAGSFADELVIHSDAGDATVGLSGTAAVGPKLSIDAPALDFGDVTAPGAQATRSFVVSNTGDAALHITKSKPPVVGDFTAVDALDEGATIAPGGSRTIRVQFAPTITGAQSDAWVLNADDGQGVRTVELTGVGKAPPRPTASPTSAVAASTVVGETSDVTVAFVNPGDTPLTVIGIKTTGPFSVISGPIAGEAMAPGASRTVTVRFTPSVAGPATGTAVLETSAGPAAVSLTGDGRAAVTSHDPAPSADAPPPDTTPPSAVGPDTASRPSLAPPLVGPDLTGAGTPPHRLAAAGLRVARPRLSRNRRTLTITARLLSGASGRVIAWLHVRVGRRQITRVVTGRAVTGRVTIRLRLAGALRGAGSARVTLRFVGTPSVRPQTARVTWVRR